MTHLVFNLASNFFEGSFFNLSTKKLIFLFVTQIIMYYCVHVTTTGYIVSGIKKNNIAYN